MNPTTIEWALNPDGSPGFTSNPFTGCLGPRGDGINCPYCYAKNLANGRLTPLYLANRNVADKLTLAENLMGRKYNDPFYPRFWPQRLKDFDVKSPRGIFVCDMSDWAAPWLPMAWKEDLMAAIRRNPQHRIYLLTHQPQELPRWSPYPDNCWVGVTATTDATYMAALKGLRDIQAKVKFLSIEPLLEEVINNDRDHGFCNLLSYCHITWLIIGSMTATTDGALHLSNRYPDLTLMRYGKMWTLQPDRQWVAKIIHAADKVQIPIFLKNNLKPLFPETFRDREYAAPPFFTPDWDYRQEMPK